MNLPEFLTVTPFGEILLTGHRIGLIDVVEFYNEGYSPEMLVCQYPTLPLALVHKVIAFYLENQLEVDAYVAACQAEMELNRSKNPRRLDVEKLRERLIAKQRTEATRSAEC